MASSKLLRFASGACIVLGVVLVTIGVILTSLSHSLFDEKGFADRAAASLGDPRVAAFVADRIATTIVSEEPDLMPFRPILVGAAGGLVRSEPFRALVRQAARQAHARLFSEGGRQVLLSIPDVGVLLGSALSNAKPELAEKISGRVGARVALPTGRVANIVLDFWEVGRRVGRMSRRALGLGVLLMVGGIGLGGSHGRRRSLLLAGASLGIAALILALLLPIGRLLLASVPGDSLGRQGVHGLWSVYMAPLRTWILVTGGLGLVIVAAAGSLIERWQWGQGVRLVYRKLADPPGGTLGRLARAAVALGFGLVAFLRPGATLLFVTTAAGAVLVFASLLELFRHLLRAGTEVAEARAHSTTGTLRTMARAAAVVGIAAAIGIGAILWARRATTPPPPATDACNGALELCDRRLDDVVFPAAHNSMSSADISNWMFPQQERGIAAQLQDGIRALMLDAHYGRQVGEHVKTDLEAEAGSVEKYAEAIGQEGVDAAMRVRDRLVGQEEGPLEVYLCHGFCELGASPFVKRLEEVHRFLIQNPNEVLVLVIEDYVQPKDLAAAVEASGLADLAYRGKIGPPWPTLRQLIDSGQRVLLMVESGRSEVDWIHPAFEILQETPYTFHAPEEFSCAPNRGGTSGSLFLVNHWIDTAPTPKPSNAAIVNAYDFLLSRLRQCQTERRHRVNIVAVDFYQTGDLFRVVRTLNGLDAPTVAATTR